MVTAMTKQRLLKKFPCTALLAALFAWAAPAGHLAAQSVQLADGSVLLVAVESSDVDGQGMRVRRLDNGGMLDLRWDQLSAASATEWKKRFDLIGDTDDELMVRADEVTYLRGGTRTSLVGRITDPSGDPLIVQAKGIVYPIPRKDLQGARKVEVPATNVYTKDEFYLLRLGEVAPGDSANLHMVLAEDLIKFRDYEHADEHLQKAKQLGNASDGAKLDTLIDRLKRFREAAKELGILEAIQVARSRGQLGDFEKGRELIAQFEQQYPNSKLKVEFDREKERFEKARTYFLTQRVADQFRRQIKTVVEKKLAEDGLSLQAAKDYAENQMTDDIVGRVAKALNLEVDEVRAMWAERAKFPIGKRTEHFTYGIGSWVLGEQAILKDTAVGKAKEKQAATDEPAAGEDREIERFAKLLRQAMERRRQQQQEAGESKEQTDEGWWREAARAEKLSWLRAYYAEFGGQLVVQFATVTPCISCYGAGTTPEMTGEGKMVQTKCFLCQGMKWLRSFKAY